MELTINFLIHQTIFNTSLKDLVGILIVSCEIIIILCNIGILVLVFKLSTMKEKLLTTHKENILNLLTWQTSEVALDW